MKPRLNPEVTWGNILIAITLIVGCGTAYWELRAEQQGIKVQLNEQQKVLERMQKIDEKLADNQAKVAETLTKLQQWRDDHILQKP